MAKGEGLSPEIEKYDAMWRKDPKSRVFAQLADAYRKSGLFDEAISVCEEGLKIHPNYASARVVLGRTFLEKGDRDKGVKELEEALKLSPDNLLSLRTLGDLYQQEGKIYAALEKFKKAFLLNPLDKEIKARLDELKALSAASPPAAALPPATPKTDSSLPPTVVMEPPPETVDTIPPAVFFPKEVAPAPPPISFPTSPPPPPPAPTLPEKEGTEKGTEPLIVLEEVDEIQEGLSLSLDDLMEEEPVAPPTAPAVGFLAATEAQKPPSEEAPAIVVQEVPPADDLGALTTSTLADLYLEQGFFDRAIEIYKKIIEGEPNNTVIKTKLTDALARKSAAKTEGGEPVYLIPEEQSALGIEGLGLSAKELPLGAEVQERRTTPSSPRSPESPLLFSPEDLAAEAGEPLASVAAPLPLKPEKALAGAPVMGDTTLNALEKLLAGARKQRQSRHLGA